MMSELTQNEVVLVTRDEINQLTASPISDEDWEAVMDSLMSNDDLWAHIDHAIKTVVEDVTN